LGAGSSLNDNITTMEYENYAAYAQGTYRFTEQFAVTGGLRYTYDESRGFSQGVTRRFTTAPPTTTCSFPQTGVVGPITDPSVCNLHFQTDSDAVTGLVSLEYKPNDDMLLYASYSRGYRAGSVNPQGPVGFNQFDPESIDAYEIGAKTTFDAGAVEGRFNIAVFYDELHDQQLQIGFVGQNGFQSTSGIVSGGESVVQGIELDTSIRFFDALVLDIGYTYLDTELKEAAPVVLDTSPGAPYASADPTAAVGGPLTYAPENKFLVGLTYFLPIPENMGELSIGANYSFTDEQLVSASSPFGTLDEIELVNLNANWTSIGGSPVDLSFFVSNALDEEYIPLTHGIWNAFGVEAHVVGPPRMYGARLRFNFGDG
jgi:iron complex outermembrane receptor protein